MSIFDWASTTANSLDPELFVDDLQCYLENNVEILAQSNQWWELCVHYKQSSHFATNVERFKKDSINIIHEVRSKLGTNKQRFARVGFSLEFILLGEGEGVTETEGISHKPIDPPTAMTLHVYWIDTNKQPTLIESVPLVGQPTNEYRLGRYSSDDWANIALGCNTSEKYPYFDNGIHSLSIISRQSFLLVQEANNIWSLQVWGQAMRLVVKGQSNYIYPLKKPFRRVEIRSKDPIIIFREPKDLQDGNYLSLIFE